MLPKSLWRLTYWSGFTLVIIGIQLVFVFHVSAKDRWIGLAALLAGALLGWQARRFRGAWAIPKQQAPVVNISTRGQILGVMIWMVAAPVILLTSVALMVFGNFSDTIQSVILWTGILLAIAPAVVFQWWRQTRRL